MRKAPWAKQSRFTVGKRDYSRAHLGQRLVSKSAHVSEAVNGNGGSPQRNARKFGRDAGGVRDSEAGAPELMWDSAFLAGLAKNLHTESCRLAGGRAPVPSCLHKPLPFFFAGVHVRPRDVFFRQKRLDGSGKTLDKLFFLLGRSSFPHDACFGSAEGDAGERVFPGHCAGETTHFFFRNVWCHSDSALAGAERGIVNNQKSLHADFGVVHF